MIDPQRASGAVAARALTRYDLGEHTIVPLAESFNTVFRVDTLTARFVLRIEPERPVHSVGAAGLEARWTDELAAQGLPVPRVVAARDGSASVRVQAGGTFDSRACIVLTWQPDRIAERQLGALLRHSRPAGRAARRAAGDHGGGPRPGALRRGRLVVLGRHRAPADPRRPDTRSTA